MKIIRMIPSGSFIVFYKWQGEIARFITLDKARAIEYAGLHNGTWHPEYYECEFDVEIPQISDTYKVVQNV